MKTKRTATMGGARARGLATVLLLGCGSACADVADPESSGTDTGGTSSATASTDASSESESESESDGADGVDSTGADSTGTGSDMECEPPPLLRVEDIPDQPTLAEVGPDTLAAFEVDGDDLIGKFVRDEAAAQGAMELWQELVLRIPTNQRPDLVQFNIFGDTDPVAWVDGTGVSNQVGRYGFTVAFSVENFELNPGGPCAPLSGRRGTFDWTLIHEFHHIRGRADRTIDGFTAQFPHEIGDGEGYPEDGTPVLDRDYVTSYAERSSGDEDAAETFTTYVMLAELPEPAEALATTKVRWFDEQEGYAELRRALRVSEGEGTAPPLDPAPEAEFPFDLSPPAWILGTWRGTAGNGVEIQYRFEESNVTYSEIQDGEEINISSYANLRDDGTLATIIQHVVGDSEYSYTKLVSGGQSGTESFSRVDGVRLDAFLEALGGAGEFEMSRVDP